ncbi:Hypothetical predicted protein [Cloeon dipterum]|uniref:Peptidase S1 domain-containing protein n=1 Tax=Cloeon dipterum TaxID=197152 RepID=A0A8S1DB62_9INSE|nr:Hypothetical predicted protein [Cloeon dipterum]
MRVLVCVLAALALTEASPAFQSVSLPVRKLQDVVEERVIGGQESSISWFPHMVAVISDETNFCGGSLISENHVVTAAHCVIGMTSSHVILGTLEPTNSTSTGYTFMSVSQTIIHYGYDVATKDNDIAMLTLGSNAPTGSNIQPVLLPRVNTNLDLTGRSAQLSGWGKISDDSSYISNVLRNATVPIVENQVCLADYGPNYVNERKLCVATNGGTVGACYGDSGSPLVLDDVNYGERIQVGVMSFGASVGCTQGYSTVYTRVTNYLQWIQDNGGPAVRPQKQ